MIIEGMKKKRQPWQRISQGQPEGRASITGGYWRFREEYKRKITVRVKRPAVIMETVKSAWQFTGHTRSMFPIA